MVCINSLGFSELLKIRKLNTQQFLSLINKYNNLFLCLFVYFINNLPQVNRFLFVHSDFPFHCFYFKTPLSMKLLTILNILFAFFFASVAQLSGIVYNPFHSNKFARRSVPFTAFRSRSPWPCPHPHPFPFQFLQRAVLRPFSHFRSHFCWQV